MHTHTRYSLSLDFTFFTPTAPPFQRAELADCPKVHSLTLKDEYEMASKKRDYHYEEEVLEFLRSFVRDNERKIDSAKKRLDLVEDNPDMEAKVALLSCCHNTHLPLPPQLRTPPSTTHTSLRLNCAHLRLSSLLIHLSLSIHTPTSL